ncbi:TlpA disulfide reductase family protein [Christiangramia sp. SM2212]|uniref:TlpA disulfide reductase family protein n=1 Tax=Christiangramia sediminicola TaxID=3073267 RepID=A0ABU1EL63_9FLAO|nr:TlpA disulfide reductase family protein [Christiangramia sp. SM2212]MDR5589101.1 TlpA disulfide reductase family protein [Christiangramia sp. SM2212]
MTKNFKIIILIVFSIFIGCDNEKEFTRIDIKIDNAENEIIFISGYDFQYERKIPSNSCILKDTLSLDQNGYYLLSLGQNSIPLFIEKNDQIEIFIDAKDFPNTVEYNGETNEINTYLLEKKLSKNVDYKLNENEFLLNINARRKSLLLKTADLRKDFRERESNELKFEYQNSLLLYPQIHSHLTNNPDFTVSENYVAKVENFNYSDPDNYQNSQTYRTTVKSYYEWLAKQKLSNYNGQFKLAYLSEINKDFQKGETKDDLIKHGLRLGLNLDDSISEIHEIVTQAVQDNTFKEEINQTYIALKRLEKGNSAPYFELQNQKGDIVSLKDFEGNPTYIDIWATWCAPCIEEIPFLKKLQKKFPDVNFVSISIDKQDKIANWKKFLDDKDLNESIQLIAFQDETFKNNYGISGIPRFILIDKYGKIIDADAIRPSNPDLEKQLSKL